jgi:hypothetical protein
MIDLMFALSLILVGAVVGYVIGFLVGCNL